MDRSSTIMALRERLAAFQRASPRGVIETPVGALAPGAVHEWCGGERGPGWLAPLCVLAGIARCLGDGLVVWVGARCWPHATTLAGCRAHGADGASGSLLARSIFVDASDAGSRLWAMDTALRSPAVAGVIGDGRAMDIACTRRLQLAAESGGAVALLARPLAEASALSSAASRRAVRPLAGRDEDREETCDASREAAMRPAARRPAWEIELLRSKGGGIAGCWGDGSHRWCVEWDYGAGALVALPVVEHGSGLASDAARERIRA